MAQNNIHEEASNYEATSGQNLPPEMKMNKLVYGLNWTSCPRQPVLEKSRLYRSSGVFCTLWSVCFYRWSCRKRCAVRICLDLCAPIWEHWQSRISGQAMGGGGASGRRGDYICTLHYFKTDSKGEKDYCRLHANNFVWSDLKMK